MVKVTSLLAACLLLYGFCASDGRRRTKQRRVKEAGDVMKEILNIPDDIPQDLLDKAECLIILPSVKKGAFGVGGSYGRGVMVCRSGEHYTGRWGPRPCTRSKESASASNWAARPQTSCCW